MDMRAEAPAGREMQNGGASAAGRRQAFDAHARAGEVVLPAPFHIAPKAVPACHITDEITRLEGDIAVLARYQDQGARQALTWAQGRRDALCDILRTGGSTADDLLNAAEAVAWSGLTRSGLDKRNGISTPDGMRWRRGDLPVRDLFGGGTPHAIEESPADGESERAPSSHDLSEAEMVKRAVARAMRG